MTLKDNNLAFFVGKNLFSNIQRILIFGQKFLRQASENNGNTTNGDRFNVGAENVSHGAAKFCPNDICPNATFAFYPRSTINFL